MNIGKDKFKLIAGGLIVLAAASLMMQPLLSYLAGLSRLITFIVTILLMAYLFTFFVTKMRGSKRSTSSGTTSNGGPPPVEEPIDVDIDA
ncbi:MAG: hypothetical protein KGS72_09505 [Cyanobacteria bacterium REEB67]|nr:hypothetical protein [Cyanobacteria bacterium REEB67]